VAPLSFAAAVPFLSAFVRSLFPAVYPRWTLRLVAAATAALSAVVLVTAARVHTWLDIPYQIVTVAGALVVMHALFAAFRRKLPEAGAFFAGFAVLFAATVNDIIFGDGLIRSADLVGVGLLVFVLSESYVLSRRSASAIELVERQTREVEGMNRAYEAEIGARTRMETELRDSQNTARALLDVPFSEAVLIDPQGMVIYHNEAFRAAVGGGEPLVGRPI
jgi:PAS domain-containing protein